MYYYCNNWLSMDSQYFEIRICNINVYGINIVWSSVVNIKYEWWDMSCNSISIITHVLCMLKKLKIPQKELS